MYYSYKVFSNVCNLIFAAHQWDCSDLIVQLMSMYFIFQVITLRCCMEYIYKFE